MINDEFGNFIIQQILKIGNNNLNKYVFNYVAENLNFLSKQKFSSNVVDKCILFNDENYRDIIINKLIASNTINELLLDQYGNYGIIYKV